MKKELILMSMEDKLAILMLNNVPNNLLNDKFLDAIEKKLILSKNKGARTILISTKCSSPTKSITILLSAYIDSNIKISQMIKIWNLNVTIGSERWLERNIWIPCHMILYLLRNGTVSHFTIDYEHAAENKFIMTLKTREETTKERQSIVNAVY